MRISQAFPSNFIKASDLQDRNVLVKMDRVEVEKIGDDEKPVLYFVGKEKGLVLNKTNASNIASAYGDDTNDWRDQELVLFPAMVDFQGRTVEAIRVRMPQAKDRRPSTRDPISSGPVDDDTTEHTNAAPRRVATSGGRREMDDEIPF